MDRHGHRAPGPTVDPAEGSANRQSSGQGKGLRVKVGTPKQLGSHLTGQQSAQQARPGQPDMPALGSAQELAQQNLKFQKFQDQFQQYQQLSLIQNQLTAQRAVGMLADTSRRQQSQQNYAAPQSIIVVNHVVNERRLQGAQENSSGQQMLKSSENGGVGGGSLQHGLLQQASVAQSLQGTQNVSRAARMQMSQKLGGQSLQGGGIISLSGMQQASNAQFQLKFKNVGDVADVRGQAGAGAGNQRSQIGQPGGHTAGPELRSLPADKTKTAQMPPFMQDTNQILRKSRQQVDGITRTLQSSEPLQQPRAAPEMRSQRIVYINATGQVQEVPKELLAEIALMQTRSNQLPSQKAALNRPIKAASIQHGQGGLGAGGIPSSGSGQSRQLDGQVPRRLSENATAASSQVHGAERNMQALPHANDSSTEPDHLTGSFVPGNSEGGLGAVSRSSAGKSQGRGRTSNLRQQAAQKSAAGDNTRPMPASVQGQLDGSNRTEKPLLDGHGNLLPQNHFGVVSLSANNEADPGSRKNPNLLGLDPSIITENNGDRTIIPSFGKNDVIIRQVKNRDFQKAENNAGYSRQRLSKNTSDKGIFKAAQQRQSPAPPPQLGKSVPQYNDQQPADSYTSMLLNQRNLEKAILQKQAANAEATGVAQQIISQSQRSRLQPPSSKYMDIENERYTKTDPMKKPMGVLDFSSSLQKSVVVGQVLAQEAQGRAQLLGEHERPSRFIAQALAKDQSNLRSVDHEIGERVQGANHGFKRSSVTASNIREMRGSQRTPRTPGSPEITNDLIEKNDSRPDGSRSPSHLDKRKLIAEGPGRDLRLLPHSNDKLGANQTKKSSGALRLCQVSLARGKEGNNQIDLLATGLQGRTFKSQKKSHQDSGLNDALNEAYYGSYAAKVNPSVGGRKHSNQQLSFAQDKLPFAQVVERQYLDSFIASSPKPVKHPMQVLSPSEESHRSHRKIDDSPRIKDDYAKGGPSYVPEDPALAISRGGTRKDNDTHASMLQNKMGEPIYLQAHNTAASVSVPIPDKISVQNGRLVQASAKHVQVKTISNSTNPQQQAAIGQASQKSLRQPNQDYIQQYAAHQAVSQQFRNKERKKSSKAPPSRHGQHNYGGVNGQTSIAVGRHLNYVNSKQAVGGGGAGAPGGSAISGKRHSSMKQKQLSIKSIGIKVDERKGTAADATSSANKGQRHGREAKRAQTQKPTQHSSQIMANNTQAASSNQAMFINHGNINININITGGNAPQNVTMSDGKQEIVQQVRGLSREQIQRLNKMSKEELSQIICSNFLLQPDGTLFQKADNFGGQLRTEHVNSAMNQVQHPQDGNPQSTFVYVQQDDQVHAKASPMKHQWSFDADGSSTTFEKAASQLIEDGSPERRSLINNSMVTQEGEGKGSAIDYGNASTFQSASFNPRPFNFATEQQAANTSNAQGLQSLNSPESPRSPDKQPSPTNASKQRVNFISGVLTQASKNVQGQPRPQLPIQQIKGQLSPPPKQSLIGARQNPLTSVLLQPSNAQQQSLLGGGGNQNGKINTSLSKTQLKKQVVQFYWQNLIQSYGVESKHGFKLDVKGKTINNNSNGSSISQSSPAPYQNPGNSSNQGSGLYNPSHYAYLSQQAQMVKQQLFSHDQQLKNSSINSTNLQNFSQQQRVGAGQGANANGPSPVKAMPSITSVLLDNQGSCKCGAASNTSKMGHPITRSSKPHDSQGSHRSCSHQHAQSLVGGQLNPKVEYRERNSSQHLSGQSLQQSNPLHGPPLEAASHFAADIQNSAPRSTEEHSPQKVCRCCGASPGSPTPASPTTHQPPKSSVDQILEKGLRYDRSQVQDMLQMFQTNSAGSTMAQAPSSLAATQAVANYQTHSISQPQGQQYALQKWLVSQYQIQQQQNQQVQDQLGRDAREAQTPFSLVNMDGRQRLTSNIGPGSLKSQYTIFDYHNQEGGYLHLFDQFGQHSHFCKCFKTQMQREQQKSSNARIFVDPYQRLNYIQQVCLQERYAAQAHQAALHQAALQKREHHPIAQAHQQNLSPKSKRKPAPVSRMDQINLFIRKLNQLINITLKATDSINPIALNQIKKLGQEIGIKWQNYLDAKFIKSKDFVTFLKSKIYVLLNNLLMKNNVTLFSQVQLMSAACQHGNKNAAGNTEQSTVDTIHPPGLIQKQEGGLVIDKKLLLQTNIGQVMINNQQWMNQIQVYNILKFKNSGFKYWVEWPNAYCNNFIVVKNVCKRRTWLSWVDHDPYEERPEPPPPQPIHDLFKMQNESQQKKHEDKEKDKQDKEKDKEKEAAPSKASQKNNSTRGSSKKKGKLKGEAAKAAPPPPPPDPSEGQSNDSGDEANDINYPVPSNCKILPNVIFTQVRRIKIVKELMHHQIYNHIDGINQIAAKCQLHRNMNAYATKVLQEPPKTIMPETYIVDLPEKMKGSYILEHEEFKAFTQAFTKDSWWIVKPGEEANRGHGIKVLNNLQKIKECLLYEFNNGPKQYKTCILQRYIENPFLVHRRKFDIRVFALLSYFANFEKQEGILRGWYYEEGYIRTSSKEFCLANGDNQFVHLTNDAVQKQSQDYGKFEAGNKLSYSDFDKLLLREKEVSFYQCILPQIKNRVGDTFKAAGPKLIGEVRSDYNGFEWLGFDFMLDDNLNLSLIEVNTNPCLETQSCILLQRLVPQMLDQSLKIAVDPFFGASEQQYQMNQEFVATEIKYSMVYEETIKGIRSTPFWDDTYLTQSPYLEKLKQEMSQDQSNRGSPTKMSEGASPVKSNAEAEPSSGAQPREPGSASATPDVAQTTAQVPGKESNE